MAKLQHTMTPEEEAAWRASMQMRQPVDKEAVAGYLRGLKPDKERRRGLEVKVPVSRRRVERYYAE